jgi:hypothetical protein
VAGGGTVGGGGGVLGGGVEGGGGGGVSGGGGVVGASTAKVSVKTTWSCLQLVPHVTQTIVIVPG